MAQATTRRVRRTMKKTDILIVESDFFLAEAYSQLIRSRTTHSVRVIQDGEAAISYIEAHNPDVMVLDMDMPKYFGFKILNMLKANNRLKDITVITLSSDPDLCRQLEKRVDYAVRKPIPQSMLMSILEQL